MKKILGILGGTVFALTLFLNSNQTLNANANEIEIDLGSNNCVCKSNQDNQCLASNFITFRQSCGSGSTDSECLNKGTIWIGGLPFNNCDSINPQ